MTRSFARGCDSALHRRRATVKLDRPLGDRKLLDGACSPACVRPSPSTLQENAEAVSKVADRIADLGKGGGFSGQKVDEEHRALTVYWKGSVPDSVRRFAESSPGGVEVTIRTGVKYAKVELARAVSRVFNDPMMRELNITFVSENYDGSGISVGISEDSITDAQLARLSKVAGVDITAVEFNAEIDLLNPVRQN